MTEMRRIKVEWECKEWDRNAGAGNQRGNEKNLDRNAKNMGNQDGDVGNHGRNLSIVVEMIWNSNGNNKFKEWREVKIIENEHICKKLVSRI